MIDYSVEIKPSKAFEAWDEKEPAFKSLGVDYYKYTHRGFNMTYSKWFEYTTLIEFHEKWQLTKPDVDEFFRVERDSVSRIRALVSGGQTEEALEFLDELATYQTLMEVRRGIMHPETLYREASVFYFDESEDPTKYDEVYAEKKISRWLQDKELINNKELFFSPVSRQIPLAVLQMPTEELESMILQMREMVRTGTTAAVLASERALTLGKLSDTDASTQRNMHLRLEILREYDHLSGLLSKRI